MSHITSTEVRSLVGVVFGKEAADTLAYVPGAPMVAAQLTPFEQNTFERTLKTIIRQTMGNRAATVFAIAEIHQASMPGNEFNPADKWGTRRWTKEQKTFMTKPLPKA